MLRSASRRRAPRASRSFSWAPRRLVSAAIRPRTSASLAFACAESAVSTGAPGEFAPSARPTVALKHKCLIKRFILEVVRRRDGKHTSLVPAAILARPKNPKCLSRMQRLFEFIGHHPYLASGAVLMAIVLAVYEVMARVQAFAALSAMQAVRLMNQGALVLDLRNKQAFDAGH